MTGAATVSDETLIAYLDGELDEAAMAAVDDAMAEDPAVADRLAAHATLADRVRAAYAPVLDEPLPAALAALVQPTAAKVVTLARPRRPSPAYAWGGAIAAALVVGVMLFGRQLPWVPQGLGPGMTAHGPLARALTGQAGGDGARPIAVGLTFRDHSGRYCRTFSADQMAGLACREKDIWKVEVAVRQPRAEASEYRTAASETPPAVLDAVDALIEGETLDAGQEAAARSRGWR